MTVVGILCNEIINVTDIVLTNVTNTSTTNVTSTVSINSDDKININCSYLLLLHKSKHKHIGTLPI